ncbi:MAG TPA: bifunctional metallophosphatase/5'-nucleotidase [Fibrobacteria bacterium]|nr:bifunctional metallophosphatase/5'-nucleotidase [Fibrobacteria bacterium]
MHSILIVLLLAGASPAGSVSDSVAKHPQSARKDTGFSLTLVHVADIHSRLDPSLESARFHGRSTRIPLGGSAILKAAFDSLRRAHPDALLLHAGDQLSGTSWYSSYRGRADAEVVRRLGVDAFVPGNHEFDGGPAVLRGFLDSSRVPVVASNLEAGREPELAGRIPSFLVREVGGRRIGIVGLVHPGAASISNPGRNLRFSDPASVAGLVDSLRKAGVFPVIGLSHAGLAKDTTLARAIPGLDCIVGGHDHLLMGSFPVGGRPLPYPVVAVAAPGRKVPVVHAWRHGMEIGVITLRFDSLARLVSWEGAPFLPTASTDSVVDGRFLRAFRPDSAMEALLVRLSPPVDSLRALRVALLPAKSSRGEKGRLADLCARSLLEAAASHGARVGLVNQGGVRDDLDSGLVTMEDVQRVAPFGNTVVVMTLTGKKLRHVVKILEGRGRNPAVAGLAGTRDEKNRWKTFRLEGAAADLGEDDTVRVATYSYLANGGDGCMPLRTSKGYRFDTGIRDDRALADLLGRLHPVPGKGSGRK